MANELTIYQSVIDDVKGIISSGMESAYNATSRAMVLTYWNVGRRIVEQEQNGIYCYDRSAKFDMDRIKAIFSKRPEHPAR